MTSVETRGAGADDPAVGGVAAPAPLGNNADFVPTPFDVHSVLPPPATVKAWHLRSLGRELLKKNGISRRMRWCGSRISRGRQGVEVFARPDRAYGRLGGVCVCGQSICCPVCAPRIAAFRAAEVAEAFKRARDAGFVASLETFTKPHALDRRPNALALEFRVFADLWRRNGKHANRQSGREGDHVAREINWGDTNGWHYHHHRLRYDRPDSFDPLDAKAQWLATLDGAGLMSEGAERFAYNCGAVEVEAGARYVAKLGSSVEAQARAVGSEVASAATKGRNINSLLADAARGDANAASVWVDGVACVTATKISSVRWSRGLRYKLGLATEKSDEEIAVEEVTDTDVLLGELNPMQWRGVLQWKAEFCLCVAANKGRDAVNEFLAGLDLGELDQPAPGAVLTPDSGEYKRKYVGL